MKRKISMFLCTVFILVLSLCLLTSCGCDHRDADDNGRCDECGERFRDGKDVSDPASCKHRDANDDGKCDKCGENFEDGDDVEDPAVPVPQPSISTYQRCDANGNADAYGDYVLFGEYPQSVKESDVEITDSQDERGYYLGSDGYYYAKVIATPASTNYTFYTGENVVQGTEYYFKVEPVRWRILSFYDGEALLLCDSIITNASYSSNGSNNYMNSGIRAWLNETFYETAFTSLQQSLIAYSTVDNSVSTTGFPTNTYACADTTDKIFLLSYADVGNTAYGFSASFSAEDSSRYMRVSDFARANGAYMQKNGYYYGFGCWWLRSPSNFFGTSRCVDDGSHVSNVNVSDARMGVVPALRIVL